MSEQQGPPVGGDGPYAEHPVLGGHSRAVRQRIADQIAWGRPIGAIKTLREAAGSGLGLKEAKDIIDGLARPGPGGSAQPGGSARRAEVASGKIDKAGTTFTLYRDGTFTTTGLLFTSDTDRLVGFSAENDSMRRKSLTGRGAAAVVTTGLTGAPLSLFTGNNRGVIYVTVTGEISGAKTYTSKNPSNSLLSTLKTLQAAADQVLRSRAAAAGASDGGGEPPAPAAPRTDIAEQLKTLSELHNTGVLSSEEFTAAKARVLAGAGSVQPSQPPSAEVQTTNVRCHKCQHVQAVPVDQQTFACRACNASLRRRRQAGAG